MSEDFGIDRPLSASSAVKILEDIELWKYEKENPKPDTAATAFGSALHCLLLEPEKFEEKFYVGIAPVNPNTKNEYKRASDAFKNWFAGVEAEVYPKKIIFREEYEQLLIAQGMLKPRIDKIFAAGRENGRILHTERKMTWKDAATGQPCIGYLDAEMDGIILDIKTTAEMNSRKLYYKCRDGYFLQAGVYAEAVKQIDKIEKPLVFLVFIRSCPPYSMKIVRVDNPTLEAGLIRFRQAIMKYRKCAEKGLFRNWDEVETTGYSEWDIRDIEARGMKR